MGIVALTAGKIMLPVVIGHHAIGDMTLELQPTTTEGQRPILGNSHSHLGNGTRIDAQRLRTTAEPVVLEFQAILFAAHGEHTMQPAHLGVSLLHDGVGAIIDTTHEVEAIAHTPAAGRVCLQRAHHAGTQIAIAAVQRAQTITVGIEP